ncbi:MAG: rhomboid family protein [Proteobacteria bacterium]|nr:rhomboid family protein [Pseudomonadota bacterium]
MDISRRRCFNHRSREAAAQCLECGRYFCRECVTEHEGKVICSGCIINLTLSTEKGKKRFRFFGMLLLFFGSLFFLWLVFYYLGVSLLKIPSSFHEGTIWKNLW